MKQGYWQRNENKSHYYNGQEIGYEIFIDEYSWQCHYINGKEIGCEQMNDSQYFYNKPGKKFGEQIEWR